jgi:pimeloyl-ACP methyl ester carboxylesterase
VNYSVNEWGSANNPTLFLLHGWGDAGGSFQFLVDELKHDWFVVAPDWRGFGNSHFRTEGYWFPDYVADLDELVNIYSADSPAQLLGHSMGANVAGLYAGIMPERVATLVNVEGFGLADSKPENAPAHYRRWIEASREKRGYAIYQSYEELVPKILQRSPRMAADKAMFVARTWACATVRGIELRADPAHKLPNAVQYRRAEALACRAAITARVLVVTGEESDFHAAAKSWLDPEHGNHAYPAAESVLIPGTGHMVHFEQPGRLATAIESFLRPDL